MAVVALIETVNLNFEYALAQHKSLLDVNVSVNSGDFIVMVGPSGSGKTTLLRQLKPELWPVGKRSGEVRFNGQPLSALAPAESAQQIGMVFQNPDDQLVMDNVIQELAFSLENIGLSATVIQKRIAELASFLGLQDLLYANVQNLSGGQKQLVNLAAVLILRPTLLLLDEPTAQLDPIATKDFMSLLQRVHDELGITIVMSEHVLDDVIPLASELWLVDNGEVSFTGDVTNGLKLLWQQPKMRAFVPDVPALFLSDEFTENVPLNVADGRKVLPKLHGKLKTKHPLDDKQKPVIAMKHVSFEYDRNGFYVLDNLDLSITPDHWLAIIGKNGTGKTTLLKVMMGLLGARRGIVKVLGKRIGNWKDQELFQQVSYLSQNPSEYFSFETVTEEYVERAKQLNLAEPEKAAAQMMSQLSITKLANQNPHDASGGEQQLIALGLLLLARPKVLLLDEPTKGLDPVRRQRLGELLKALQLNQQLTIVMVSHDMAFSARFADQCALLFDGKIVSQAEPHQFFAENFFYTTNINRLVRQQLPEVIDREEINY